MQETSSPSSLASRAGLGEGEDTRRVGVRRFLLAAVGSFAVWLLLVGSIEAAELVAGALVALLTAVLAAPRLALLDGVRLRPGLPWYLLRFAGVFTVALIRANLDMARRVLSPSLPIRPAVVEVETRLQSPLGKLLLANSITLTPGTLTVDVLGDRLQVHWIDVSPGADLARATRAIAERFERELREFLR